MFKVKDFDYYIQQSVESDPGKFTCLYKNLPDSIGELSKIVYKLIAHRDGTYDLYGFKLSKKEYNEANKRYIEDILRTILGKNGSTLEIARSPKFRFFGTCRDFAQFCDLRVCRQD